MNTTNQLLTKQGRTILSVPERLTKFDSTIAANNDFITAVQALSGLQGQIDSAWTSIRQAMETYHVTKLDGDWGIIQLIQAGYLKADLAELAPRFTKAVIATDKVKAYQVLHNGELPAGVISSTGQKFYKKIK